MTVYSGFDYDWPIDRLIHLFKYQARLDLLPILIQGLTTHATPAVDALVAVPMSAQRLRERGFNQAHILAKALGQQWGIPVWQGVERQRHTLRQQSLDRLDRLDNLQNAFAVQPCPPTRVMLIDDVFTTGSTLQTLAQTLSNAGVQQIDASVIASVTRSRR
jgi:ComF family protein